MLLDIDCENRRYYFLHIEMNTTSINTPKAYEIIEHDGRHGIVSDKITGESEMSRMYIHR